MKGAFAVRLRQFCSRYGARVMLPVESAELEDVRGFGESDALAFEELHTGHALVSALRYSESRIFDVIVLDRGILDRRAWFLDELRVGNITKEEWLRCDDFLRRSAALRRLTACYFFTCTPNVSLQREYSGALSKKRGKKMNEESLARKVGVWKEIYEDTLRFFPNLPCLEVDTTDCFTEDDIENIGWIIVEHLLSALEKKFLTKTPG